MFTPILLSMNNVSDLTETAPISQACLHMATYLSLHKKYQQTISFQGTGERKTVLLPSSTITGTSVIRPALRPFFVSLPSSMPDPGDQAVVTTKNEVTAPDLLLFPSHSRILSLLWEYRTRSYQEDDQAIKDSGCDSLY